MRSLSLSPSPYLLIALLSLLHQGCWGQFFFAFEVPDRDRAPISSLFDVSSYKILSPSQLSRRNEPGLQSSAQNNVQQFTVPPDSRFRISAALQNPGLQPTVTDPRLLGLAPATAEQARQLAQPAIAAPGQPQLLPRTPGPDVTFSPGPPPFSEQPSHQTFLQSSAIPQSALAPQSFSQPLTSRPQAQPQQLTPAQIAALNFFNGQPNPAAFEHLRAKMQQAQRQQAQPQAAPQLTSLAEAELRTRQQAELRARQEAEHRARQEAELRARQEAEIRARQEAEIRARQEAEIRARQEAELRARQEAEHRARQEAELRARQEAEHRARQEAEMRARQEAELRARKEAQLQAERQRELEAAREAVARAKATADAAANRLRSLEAQLIRGSPVAQRNPSHSSSGVITRLPDIIPQSAPISGTGSSIGGDLLRVSAAPRPEVRNHQAASRQVTSSSGAQVATSGTSTGATVSSSSPSSSSSFRTANLQIAQLPADTDGDGIPGEAGKDYPTLTSVPATSFSCSKQPLTGYYADTETACQVVHFCQKGGVQDSFLCPNGTIFNQEKFSCQWWYEVDCGAAPRFYALNDNLYRQPATQPSSDLDRSQESSPRSAVN